MAQMQNLGVVSPTPKGEWEANTQYNYLNVVTLNGSSYIAKVANVNIEPNATTGWDMYWQLLAQGVENAETNAVLFTQQALTNVQQAQARQNIGATSSSFFLRLVRSLLGGLSRLRIFEFLRIISLLLKRISTTVRQRCFKLAYCHYHF